MIVHFHLFRSTVTWSGINKVIVTWIWTQLLRFLQWMCTHTNIHTHTSLLPVCFQQEAQSNWLLHDSDPVTNDQFHAEHILKIMTLNLSSRVKSTFSVLCCCFRVANEGYLTECFFKPLNQCSCIKHFSLWSLFLTVFFLFPPLSFFLSLLPFFFFNQSRLLSEGETLCFYNLSSI